MALAARMHGLVESFNMHKGVSDPVFNLSYWCHIGARAADTEQHEAQQWRVSDRIHVLIRKFFEIVQSGAAIRAAATASARYLVAPVASWQLA
jgi:hypothetical protein